MAKITRRNLLGAMASGLLAGASGAAYSQGCADDLRVESKVLRLPKWGASGFRCAVLGDLHMNSPREAERATRALELVGKHKPDALFLVGDFVDGSGPRILPNIKSVLRAVGDLDCPTFAVMGNHDYWTPQPDRVIEELRSCPLRLLRNETAVVQGVSIIGVDDSIARRDRYDFFPVTSIAESSIALLHEPDSVKNMPEHVALQLSGHSHGGQICLPMGVPVHTPYGARDYIEGFYPLARVPLYVTRGVGTTGPNFRLFCPPEVSLLTLEAA